MTDDNHQSHHQHCGFDTGRWKRAEPPHYAPNRLVRTVIQGDLCLVNADTKEYMVFPGVDHCVLILTLKRWIRKRAHLSDRFDIVLYTSQTLEDKCMLRDYRLCNSPTIHWRTVDNWHGSITVRMINGEEFEARECNKNTTVYGLKFKIMNYESEQHDNWRSMRKMCLIAPNKQKMDDMNKTLEDYHVELNDIVILLWIT